MKAYFAFLLLFSVQVFAQDVIKEELITEVPKEEILSSSIEAAPEQDSDPILTTEQLNTINQDCSDIIMKSFSEKKLQWQDKIFTDMFHDPELHVATYRTENAIPTVSSNRIITGTLELTIKPKECYSGLGQMLINIDLDIDPENKLLKISYANGSHTLRLPKEKIESDHLCDPMVGQLVAETLLYGLQEEADANDFESANQCEDDVVKASVVDSDTGVEKVQN